MLSLVTQVSTGCLSPRNSEANENHGECPEQKCTCAGQESHGERGQQETSEEASLVSR